MTDATQRQRWVVEHLGLTGRERVLEFGCGPGVAAGLVAARLTTGMLLAVDRSPLAAERTATRVASSPRARVECSALADLRAPLAEDGGFDVAFGVDVNAFWTSDARAELTVLARVLAPGGRLSLCFSPGPTGAERIVPAVRAALSPHPFTDHAITEAGAVLAIDAVRRR